MVDVLEFIFSSFLHYLGVLVMILSIVLPFASAISDLGPKEFRIVGKIDDMEDDDEE